MKLSRVFILNYRSIKNIEINFNHQCRVFVGINESGKSNILRALSTLSKEKLTNKINDLREALPDEDPITDSYIRFIFTFENADVELFKEELNKLVILNNKDDKIAFNGKKEYSLNELLDHLNEAIYEVDIMNSKKLYKYWIANKLFSLKTNLKKPSDKCPKDYYIDIDGTSVLLYKLNIISSKYYESLPMQYLSDATFSDLWNIIGICRIKHLEQNIPNLLFFEYTETNLLPNSINIAEFSYNPDKCIPLKNMFILAGIKDIKKGLDEAKKTSLNQFQSYLHRVANRTTQHFREVWKEYKHIEFSLILNGDLIIPGIKEKNTHDFFRRSDGFKRFVTFLLTISVNVKTDSLKNSLLLIDEPEIGLHPSGIRYLRDELLNISKTNYVAYTSHSIFMIDTDEIERHYIVEKINEITSVKVAQSSNIVDEEVIFNALGYSIFDSLKEKNIIFEGWNDKKLFLTAMEKPNKILHNKFKLVGICHANGVKSIKNITPILDLANRECIIISDNDFAAIEQKKLYEKDGGTGKWFLYKDINDKIDAVTGEDFLKNDYIVDIVNSTLENEKIRFSEKDFRSKYNKIASINNWLQKNGYQPESAKNTISEIKKKLFMNIKLENIEQDYFTLLKSIII